MVRILKMSNVGNGLHITIPYTIGYHKYRLEQLIIDYGGEKNLNEKHLFGDFILSHFHRDHYNGFLTNRIKQVHFPNFYYPAMPIFPDNKRFYLSLLAINAYMGIQKGEPLQHSLFTVIKKLNCPSCYVTEFKHLAKGDRVTIDDETLEVLWPPAHLNNHETNTKITKAIADFNKAREADPELALIYDRIYQTQEESLPEEAGHSEGKDRTEKWQHNKEIQNTPGNDIEKRGVEDAIHKDGVRKYSSETQALIDRANNSLRSAANDMSLAFSIGDSLLFLGDLERPQIEIVVNELVQSGKIEFKIIIAAHHGTHWSNALQKLNSEWCLASVGNLVKHLRNEYLSISREFLYTQRDGKMLIGL